MNRELNLTSAEISPILEFYSQKVSAVPWSADRNVSVYNLPFENSLLNALQRYKADGAALYEPYEEPFESQNKLPSAKELKPILFQEIIKRIYDVKSGWFKKGSELNDPNAESFWKLIYSTQNQISKKAPNFPLDPDQTVSEKLVFLRSLMCDSKHLVLTLIVYSLIDYEFEKLFASLRNRVDGVLGRSEKASDSIHNVQEWLKNLSTFEQLGAFNNLVKPSPPYWKSAYSSLLESLEFHDAQLSTFRKAEWPHRHLHIAYAAEKTNKEKAYKTWSIAGLVELLDESGLDHSKSIGIVESIYQSLGLSIKIQSFLTRQETHNWELPDPVSIWPQLSANLYAISLSPDIGKLKPRKTDNPPSRILPLQKKSKR